MCWAIFTSWFFFPFYHNRGIIPDHQHLFSREWMVLQMEWIPSPEGWSELVSSLPVNSPIVALNLLRTKMTRTEYFCYHGTSYWSWQGPSDGDLHRPRTDASMLIYLLRNQIIRVKTFAVLRFYLTETMLCCRFIRDRCWHVAKKSIRVIYRYSTTKWSQPLENYVSIFCQEMMFCIVTDLEGKKNLRRGFKPNIRFLSFGF